MVAVEERILVLAPTGRDGALVCSVLRQARIDCLGCTSIEQVCQELSSGAGALIVAEEALAPETQRCLLDWLNSQPTWSDLPVLLLARRGADSATLGHAIEQLVNVIVVERPTRIAALVSVARTALRARHRQYLTRRHLEEREQVESQLRTNDRRKDEFLAVLAHELRNPLAPIASALHIFRMHHSEDPEFNHLGEMMGRQVEHLVRLVDDLLEVSRITRGKVELRKAPLDMACVVRHAVEASRPLIDAVGHQLVVELPDEPIVVDADSVRLAQVLSNLLNNAAKYTNPGGRIELRMTRTATEVVTTVRDSGIGIPAQMLQSVFDMFTQVESTMRRSNGGLGIGLTLVKSIVELHGGSVQAASDGPGLGSEFVVRLPLISRQSEDRVACKSTSDSQLSGRRILVVDDNHDAATSLARLLVLLGADAQVALSGADALRLLAPDSHDVVLLDIGMPGMDGYEVARKIRARPELEGLLLVALSGWGQVEDIRRSEEAGIDSHLIKPVDVVTLNERLAALIR